MGLLPDGEDPEAARNRGEPGDTGAARAAREETSLTREQALRHRSFYLLAVAFSLVFVAAPALNLHMLPYMTDQGIAEGYAVIAVALQSMCAGIGSIATGSCRSASRRGARLWASWR